MLIVQNIDFELSLKTSLVSLTLKSGFNKISLYVRAHLWRLQTTEPVLIKFTQNMFFLGQHISSRVYEEQVLKSTSILSDPSTTATILIQFVLKIISGVLFDFWSIAHLPEVSTLHVLH